MNARRPCLAPALRILWLAAGLLIAATWAGKAPAQPSRIVSLNLCTDQLVMLMADRDNIASVSYTAEDPDISAYPDLARGLPVNYGLAEEVLAQNPDLVISSTFSPRPTLFLLRRLGYEVVEVPTVNSVDDIISNIRIVADAVGAPEYGETLAAELARDFAAARPAADDTARPLAVFYWANGFTSGAGTLPDNILHAVGFRTVADEMGITGMRQLPLELLITAEPDVLVISQTRKTPALANQIFSHPALARAFAGRPVAFMPNTLFNCGTPAVAKAFDILSDLRKRFLANARPAEVIR
ncbi:MAG: ABC transporter substrate-binding protein [Alphaproteobacteria bacterium]|nr:ABC transporter substrate-binding protein [Alphaproteobacteria bacterium]